MSNFKQDVSIHFSTDGQSIDFIRKALNGFEGGTGTTDKRVHQCFLSKDELEAAGIPLDVPFFFESITVGNVCWSGVTQMNLEEDRKAMLENLKKLNGTALFLGELKGGVLVEYEMAKELGIEIVHLEK